MATWPSTVPVRKDGFSETTPNRQLRSNMEIGPDKVRKRTSIAIRTLTVSMFLTTAQVATFDAFYLVNDSLIFDFVHPRTGVTVHARFLSEPPTYNSNETMWDVSVKLEIIP
jgi:hypothetical protein